MLDEKEFRNILKIIRKYQACLDGYRLIISKEQAEIKLSYKDGREYSESVWMTGKTVGWGNNHKEHIDMCSVSIEMELQNKYPYVD